MASVITGNMIRHIPMRDTLRIIKEGRSFTRHQHRTVLGTPVDYVVINENGIPTTLRLYPQDVIEFEAIEYITALREQLDACMDDRKDT